MLASEYAPGRCCTCREGLIMAYMYELYEVFYTKSLYHESPLTPQLKLSEGYCRNKGEKTDIIEYF